MCGNMNENVVHLMCECSELAGLREEVFGKGVYDEEWMVKVMKDECFTGVRQLGRFLKLSMKHRERFI